MLGMLSRAVACACVFAFSLACSSDHHDEEDNPALSDVIYVGGTTDEALEVMLDAAPKDVASQHVTFISPEASATLSKDTPATIEFHAPSAKNQRFEPPWSGVPERSFIAELKQLLTPIGVAYAHGTPFNGTAYFLVFEDAYRSARLRVFTNQSAYTPTSTEWAALAGGPQPIRVSVTSATFEENAVLADGGPFVAGALEFSIR
jgi:hypothetical protein